MRSPTKFGSIGDPMSELNVRRRFQIICESYRGHDMYVPRHMVDADPAFQLAVERLPWLKVREP